MTPREARFLHVSTVLVGGTGLAYAWTRYLAEPADPFAVANHPWQPHLQHAHIVAAPLLVFACGLVWRDHVWRRLRSGFRRKRRTGACLAIALAPMVVSGYLLQVATAELARTAWIGVHLVASCVWLPAYAVHQWLGSRTAAEAAAPPPAPR